MGRKRATGKGTSRDENEITSAAGGRIGKRGGGKVC